MYNDLDVEKGNLELEIEDILHEFKNEEEFELLQNGFDVADISKESKLG